MIGWTVEDGVAHLPDLIVQTVAARTVAEVLVALAGGRPAGRAADLAGPDQRRLIDLAQAFVARRGGQIVVELDDQPGIPPGALLPGADARVEPPSFDEWLETEDAAALAL
jgi:hypothetical protein